MREMFGVPMYSEGCVRLGGAKWCSLYSRRMGHHPEGPGKAQKVGAQETKEVQQVQV